MESPFRLRLLSAQQKGRYGTLEVQRRLAGSLREALVTQLQPKPDEAQQDPEPKGHLPCCRTVSEMADDDQHDATRTEDVLQLDRSYTSQLLLESVYMI
jgi:hypothetical protein